MSLSLAPKEVLHHRLSAPTIFRNLTIGIRIIYIPNIRSGSLFDSARRSIQAIAHPLITIGWLNFIESFVGRYDLPTASSLQIAKPFGKYVLSTLKTEERVSMLQAHYTLAVKSLPSWVFACLWHGSEIKLGCLSGKDGSTYHLLLGPAGHCYKEGEYSFRLIDAADGLPLAQITFLLVNTGGGLGEIAVLIGGLQGPSIDFKSDAKKRIVSATRALSGLRPKMAVFSAVLAFAASCKAKSLLAVSNETHIINTDAQYQRRRRRADYNSFWVERGGVSDCFGYHFSLEALLKSELGTNNRYRRQIAGFVEGVF